MWPMLRLYVQTYTERVALTPEEMFWHLYTRTVAFEQRMNITRFQHDSMSPSKNRRCSRMLP